MNIFAWFLAKQIISGMLDYTEAVTRRPDYKADIDQYLTDTENEHLIVEVEDSE